MPLEIRHLDHTYSEGSPFEFKALKDINLNIEDGQFVGLIGHTGSGKSTLIQHLNGLLQPTGGTVLFNGADIFTEKKEALIQIRHKIGLVFQYPEHQLFEEILNQIKTLHEKKKITVILVSHSMEDVGKLVDKIIVMHAGEVVFFDTPARVFTQIDTLESIGLAVPEVTYLMRELKKKYPDIREDIFTVEAARQEIERVVRRESDV